MAYVLEPTEPVSREVRAVVSERLSEAISILSGLEGAEPEEIERAVHDVRKRCKEVRAAARLVRSSIGREFAPFNAIVKEAADTLGPIRDAHAVLSTFDDLRSAQNQDDDSDLAEVRTGQADAAAEATRTVHGGDPRIKKAQTLLVSARKRVKRWKIGKGFAPLASGLERTYKQGRRDLRRARSKPTDHNLHEWRKSLKTLWYQTRLIERAAPSMMGSFVATLDDVAEALGDDHDLAVLVERLSAKPERFGGKRNVKEAIRLARSQQKDLRRRAFRLGATVYAESPAAFTTRMGSYWNITRRNGPELLTGGIAELAADERSVDRPESAPASTSERERKFLVTSQPDVEGDGTTLRQGYLAIEGSVSVRVRDSGEEGCTLTMKAGKGAVRTELEFAITAEQFAAAWPHTGGRSVHKTRYELPLGDHVIELDVFHDELQGLVMAEVEFDDDESMAAFEPPDWFGPEVTDDDSYTNASLAVNAPSGLPRQPAA
ncbi:MAG: CHAD domain-containing protein [Acidimicrobiales bacterium]